MSLEQITEEIKPDLEEIKKAKSPFGKLFDFYIDIRYGIPRKNYLKNKSEITKKEALCVGTFNSWFNGGSSFSLKYLKAFANELKIPLEEVIAINNSKDPFKPDFEKIKREKNSIGKLIDFYINLRYGCRRRSYLKNKSKIAKKEGLKADTIMSWVNHNSPFPLKYLKDFIEELKIPLKEIKEINNSKNPFKPDLEEIKKAKSPYGKLIDFYIDLRYGVPRESYLENKITRKEKAMPTIINWIRENKRSFPLKYLKGFVDELKIPLEEVIELNNNQNPFEPNLEKFKKAKNSIGKLIDFYIDLRYGISRDNYQENKSKMAKKEKLKKGAIKSWFRNKNPFPLKYLNGFAKELNIPLKKISEVNNGKNPFKPDLEELREVKNPLGKLIDFYIDLRYGISRDGYLKNKSKTVKKEKINTGTFTNWIIGNSPFPLKYLKAFANELKIPYSEVNYLINGDIENGIARAGNVSIEPGTELIFDSVKYYIQQYQKGQKERPSLFYPKKHSDFEEKYGVSTRQIYRSLNK